MSDNRSERKYNDPDKQGVEQFSLDYLRRLRASGQNEELVRLFNLGHFRDAIAAEAESKSSNRTYHNWKGTKPGERRSSE